MVEAGFNRDGKQCNAKIKDLKNDYKKVKDSNSRIGQVCQVMKFFDQLNEILAMCDATQPPQVLENTGNMESDSEPEEEEVTNSITNPDVKSSDVPQGQGCFEDTAMLTPCMSSSSIYEYCEF